MYIIDYHTHPFAHGEKKVDKKVYINYIKQAKKMNIQELGFSDHDEYFSKIDWDMLIDIKEHSDIKIKIGLEFDYIPGKERIIENMIEKVPFDYCIGSVHKIGDWEFDHPAYKSKYLNRNIVSIYEDYFELLKKAVKSKLFDIIGHLDLIKIFNFRPENFDIMKLVTPVLKLIKMSGVAIEINSNGLNKPVGEMYPGKKILRKARKLNIPVVSGSDAHTYKRVGSDLTKAFNIITDVGYSSIATFDKHQLKQVKI